MKHFVFIILTFLAFQLSAQISFDVENDSVGFTDNFVNSQVTTWRPLNLEFHVPDLSRTSLFSGSTLSFMNTGTSETTFLENGVLKFQEIGGGPDPEDRMSLAKDHLFFVNSASWTVLQAQVDAAGAGEFNIYNPSGAMRVDASVINDHGRIQTFGSDGSLNAGMSAFNGSNRGYIFVSPSAFFAAAGMYIDNSDQGILFADVKNFRMKHPEEEDMEIWYASIEGPEVAAYDRGTAQLEDGEAFVSFKDHFKHVADTENMTIILTPIAWDTYGLGVIEKTQDGFRVKELKGGSGNFEFDWEVKCVRTGKNNYKVLRERDRSLDPSPIPGR